MVIVLVRAVGGRVNVKPVGEFGGRHRRHPPVKKKGQNQGIFPKWVVGQFRDRDVQALAFFFVKDAVDEKPRGAIHKILERRGPAYFPGIQKNGVLGTPGVRTPLFVHESRLAHGEDRLRILFKGFQAGREESGPVQIVRVCVKSQGGLS